jgi:hypothetical protein
MMNNFRSVYDMFVQKYSRLPTEVDPDYLEMLRMSKYHIEDVPMYKPGKCGNCGSSKNDGRKYVDFGLELDWYGTVYLCGLCLRDVAQTMGLFKDLENALMQAEMKNVARNDLQEQGVELHDKVVQAFKEFEEFYADVSASSVDNNIVAYPGPDTVEATSEPGTNQTESKSNATKSRTTKSSASSGRQNIRSLAELLEDTNKR